MQSLIPDAQHSHRMLASTLLATDRPNRSGWLGRLKEGCLPVLSWRKAMILQ